MKEIKKVRSAAWISFLILLSLGQRRRGALAQEARIEAAPMGNFEIPLSPGEDSLNPQILPSNIPSDDHLELKQENAKVPRNLREEILPITQETKTSKSPNTLGGNTRDSFIHAPETIPSGAESGVQSLRENAAHSLSRARKAITEFTDGTAGRPSDGSLHSDLAPTTMPEEMTAAKMRRRESGFLAKTLGYSPELKKLLPSLIFKRDAKDSDWENLANFLGRQHPCDVTWGLYNSIRNVAMAEKPARERAALALHLSSEYAKFLDKIVDDQRMPVAFRKEAKAAVKPFSDGTLVQALLLARQDRNQWKQTASLSAPQEKRNPKASPQDAKEPETIAPWLVPTPEAENKTGKAGEVNSFQWSLREISTKLVNRYFFYEKALSRRRLASAGPIRFSRKLKTRLTYKISKEFKTLRNFIYYYDTDIDRFIDFTIYRGLFPEKKRRVISVANYDGLEMAETASGFVIRAHFLTDIDNQAVLDAVKTSIEDYWRGEFSYSGKTYNLQTEVSIERIKPGTLPSSKQLQILDGFNQTSHVGRGEPIIVLGRTSLSYTTAAHEFGHILGLNDEYQESYNFSSHQGSSIAPYDSLMAQDRTGNVLPRHLKIVYQLLRRHSLARERH